MPHPAKVQDNPAQVRGDINRGRTGDKRPGFDPAAAPLETDSEAGGAALTPEQVAMARRGQARGTEHSRPTSYATAMRELAGAPAEAGKTRLSTWLVVGAAIVLLAIGAISILLP